MKRLLSATACLVGAGFCAALLAQGFNLRPGTWEFNMTMSGAMPMEGIPPAMRAQVEAEMRKPRTSKSCVTPEDVKEINLGKTDDDDEECKTLSSKITATSADATRQCTGDQPRTETMHFEAVNPQSLRGTIARKSAAGTMTIAMTGRWLAAQCKD